jgi:hypothetical protein
VIAILFGLGILAYVYSVYSEIDADTKTRVATVVKPREDSESISEVGSVQEIRDKMNWSGRHRDIRWWVRVPTTNKTWACQWEAGFNGFAEDEGVLIIHKQPGHDWNDWTGYIVGIHGRHQGKAARVWALDLDDVRDLVDRP